MSAITVPTAVTPSAAADVIQPADSRFPLCNEQDRPTQCVDLVARVCSGDTEAFYVLIRPYLLPVRNLVRSFVANAHDAEDVVQEAILTAFIKLHQLRSPQHFRPWLMQIAVNEARMHLRVYKRRNNTECLDEGNTTELKSTKTLSSDHFRNTPHTKAEEQQIREKVWKSLDRLRPGYREVIILRDLREFSVKETAAILGLSVSVTKARLYRARLHFRRELREICDRHKYSKALLSAEMSGCQRIQ
jgi:RNA polymerase sigma-70 factor, ECF subfamily